MKCGYHEMDFVGCNWQYEDIDMQEPEYTPTHVIILNFILSVYPFPEEIIEILLNDDWTVTDRHRMGLKSHTTQEIVWRPWDNVLRNLVHLHPDTVDRGSPPYFAPHHVSPDGVGHSSKRKLDKMVTMLNRWVIG